MTLGYPPVLVPPELALRQSVKSLAHSAAAQPGNGTLSQRRSLETNRPFAPHPQTLAALGKAIF